MSTPVIAIDGPAASGKSTAARNLAARLGIPYINTGSLYRAIAWKAARLGISTRDEAAVRAMLADTSIRYAAPAPGANPDIEIDGTFPGQDESVRKVMGKLFYWQNKSAGTSNSAWLIDWRSPLDPQTGMSIIFR